MVRSCHIHIKRSETAEKQGGASHQWNIRDQYCRDCGEDDDRNDRKRKCAVVDKQPGQFAQQHHHDSTSAFGRRASTTAAALTARNIAANPMIAKSAPGQATPSPSPVQNTPNADSMTPTANLSVFSGTRASGRCTTRPTTATPRHAASAPALAGTSIPRPAPTAITMNTTSSPSSSTALNVVIA